MRASPGLPLGTSECDMRAARTEGEKGGGAGERIQARANFALARPSSARLHTLHGSLAWIGSDPIAWDWISPLCLVPPGRENAAPRKAHIQSFE